MTLLPLSLQYVTGHRDPVAPDNAERYRALRNALPVVVGNGVFHFPARNIPDPPAWGEVVTDYADHRGY